MPAVEQDSVIGVDETGGITQLTIPWTAAPSEGELLFSSITVDKSSGALAGGGTGGVPTGWTLINTNPDASVSTHSAWKIAGASEAATVVWDWTTASGGGGAVGFAGAWTGIDNLDVTAFADSADIAVAFQTSGTTPATAVADSFAIAYMGVDTWLVIGSGMTQDNAFVDQASPNSTGTGGPGMKVAVKALISTGTQETTFTGTSGTDQMSGGVVVFNLVATVPQITDFGDEEHDDKETGVPITGSFFEAVQGTGVVEVSDNAVFGAGTIVEQVVTAWAAGSITITMALGAIAPGTPRYLWVTNDSGDNNTIGFQFHFHRERMFKLELSADIPSGGGGSNTTQQMTPPSGKSAGDFGGGKITDDINPATNLTDVPANDYREDEQNYLAIVGAAVPGTTHEFRDTIGGVPMDVESVNPRWTLLEGGSVPVTHPSRVVSRQSSNRASNF